MPTRAWTPVATLRVEGHTTGPLLLPRSAMVTIGRSPRAGLRSASPRAAVPRELASLTVTNRGVLIANEGGTVGREPVPMRAIGPDILDKSGTLFAPRASILLGRGDWTLMWETGVRVTVTLRPARAADAELAEARDPEVTESFIGTVPPESVRLSSAQRRHMAALFAYRIRGQGRVPRQPFAEAASLMEREPLARSKIRDLVKSEFKHLVVRINRGRHREEQFALDDLESVGDYLIRVTRTLSELDLEDVPDGATAVEN